MLYGQPLLFLSVLLCLLHKSLVLLTQCYRCVKWPGSPRVFTGPAGVYFLTIRVSNGNEGEMDCNTLINVNWFDSIFTLIFLSMVVPIPVYLSCVHFGVSFMDCCQVAPCWKWTLVYNSKFINTVSVNRYILGCIYLWLPLFVFWHALSYMCMYTHTHTNILHIFPVT